MKKVLLHDQGYIVGGPKAVLTGIESNLGHKVKFIRLLQQEACGYNPIKAIKFINKYRKAINKHHADVIYICGLEYTGFLMTLAAKFSNVKRIVLSVHGSFWDIKDTSLRVAIIKYLIEPLEVFWADKVFTVCEEAQRHIKALKFARKGCNKGVVYNTFPIVDYKKIESGLVRKEFDISNDKIVVSVVGRIHKDKGHQYIIDAIKKLNDQRFVFMIVGTGEFSTEYMKQCKKEIECKRIILTGARNDVSNILKDSDIFLFATLHENHSIALLEAVNMHCATLVTNIGGNPEIIEDKRGGILIPEKDSDAIVKGLLQLANPTLRKQYTEYAYNYAKEKFSFENTYEKLERILVD